MASGRGVTCAAKKLKDKCNKIENQQAFKDLMMELDVLLSVKKHRNLVEFYGACVTDLQNLIIFEEFICGPSLEVQNYTPSTCQLLPARKSVEKAVLTESIGRRFFRVAGVELVLGMQCIAGASTFSRGSLLFTNATQ